MTMKEKAKRYDEALALMKDCIPDKDGYVCVRPCDIFQELKESEDDEQYLLVCKNALRKYQVSDKWDADIISKWLEDKLKQRLEG